MTNGNSNEPQQNTADGPQFDQSAAPASMSPAQAAELVATAGADVRGRWLQLVVNVANAIKSGQAISNGTFEDMRQLRERFEELERARLVLQGMAATDQPNAGPSDNKAG